MPCNEIMRLLQLTRGWTMLSVLILLCACGPQSRSREIAVTADDQAAATADNPATLGAAMAVDDYIVKSKHWERGSYQVKFKRKEGTSLVFWVINSQDLT